MARARAKTSPGHVSARSPATKPSGRQGVARTGGSAKAVSGKKRTEKAEVKPEAEEIVEIVAIAEPVRAKTPPLRDALYFDSEWYLTNYPDVASAGVDAATHYRTVGYQEGRQPNAAFDGKEYVAANPDLLGYEGDLFLHYVFYGASEGRPLAP